MSIPLWRARWVGYVRLATQAGLCYVHLNVSLQLGERNNRGTTGRELSRRAQLSLTLFHPRQPLE